MSTSPRRRERWWWRPASLVTTLVFLTVNTGCAVWRTSPIATDAEILDLVGKTVRIHVSRPTHHVVEMIVTEVSYPYIRGRPYHYARTTTEEADLREVSLIEVRDIDGWRTTLLVTGVVAFAVVVAVAAAASTSSGPSSSGSSSTSGGGAGSCPIVYVENEQESQLVGDAYAGAIFRSIQRTDLLPLPRLRDDRATLVLADEAPETQYTDFLELVLVDHASGTRAVSTIDQIVTLIGDAVPPIHVADFIGTDVTDRLANADGDLWRTDFPRLLASAPLPLRDGLIATFARPDPTERPVLELSLVNSYWLNRSVAELFTMMEAGFDDYLARGNLPTARPMVEWWSDREGVSLDVEWRRGDRWERVARVAPVGQAALRRVAVPLPEELGDTDVKTLTFRVSSGTGFWELDQIGLSSVREAPMEIHRLAPVRARNDRGEDERGALAAMDDRYQILGGPGEHLQVDFDLPPRSPDRVRSAFLFSRGYYNLHAPLRGTGSFGDLDTIRSQPGGLSRLAFELYRRYSEIAATLPRCTIPNRGGA